jgi:hypothetical protein
VTGQANSVFNVGVVQGPGDPGDAAPGQAFADIQLTWTAACGSGVQTLPAASPPPGAADVQELHDDLLPPAINSVALSRCRASPTPRN